MDITPEPFTEMRHRMCFTNDKSDLTVMEVYERYRKKIPFLLEVTVGNYAETDLETFGSEQMFWVNSVSNQKRVIARDIQGRFLTIPVNLPVKFRFVKGYKNVGPIQPLEEIITQNELPIQVQFAMSPNETFKIGSWVTKGYQFGNVVITEIYEEKYFLGNGVIHGVLQTPVALMPLYLKEINVAMVTGIVGANKKDWDNFLIGLLKATESIKYDLTLGNKDVALLPEDCALITSDNIYDYIDANCFVNLKKRKESDKGTGELNNNQGNYYSEVGEDFTPPKLPSRKSIKKKLSNDSCINELETKQVKSRVSTGSSDEVFCSGGSLKQGRRNESSDEASISGGSIQSRCCDFVLDHSIRDISESLTKLKLNKYVESLREAQMDGAFLLSMDEDVLKDDFNMKKFEAVKLMLFARTGHIPM